MISLLYIWIAKKDAATYELPFGTFLAGGGVGSRDGGIEYPPCRSRIFALTLLSFSAYAQDGADLYKERCAPCHDTGHESRARPGHPQTDVARGRAVRAAHRQYGTDGHRAFLRAVESGRHVRHR